MLSHHFTQKRVNNRTKGALLLEVIIVIAILAIIMSLGAQASYVSLSETKMVGEKDVARSLSTEMIEAVRGATDEKWQNLYGLTKGMANHHFATQTAGRWALDNGDEIVSQNDISYTRYFVVENVSRHQVTRAIEAAYNASNDDPSTQKVTVFVSWGNGNTVSASDYFSRWRNKICLQTDWSGGAGSGIKNCPNTTYDSDDGHMNASGGMLQLQ